MKLHWLPVPKRVIAHSAQRHVSSQYIRRPVSTTIVIVISSDGHMLPMQIIFKDDRKSDRSQPHSALTAFETFENVKATTAQDTPFTTVQTLLHLLRHIVVPDLQRRREALGADGNRLQWILTLDSWSAHTNVDFWDACGRQGGYVSIIPKSATPFVQPLDTHCNKIIRAKFEKGLMNRVVTSMVSETLEGMRHPCRYRSRQQSRQQRRKPDAHIHPCSINVYYRSLMLLNRPDSARLRRVGKF